MQDERIRSAQNKQTVALLLALIDWLRVAIMAVPALLSWAVPLFDNDDVLSKTKDKLHQGFEKEENWHAPALPMLWRYLLSFILFVFWGIFLDNILTFFLVFLLFFWMKWPLTCTLVELLLVLSDPSLVTGIYLWNPSPFPSSPTSELTHTLSINDSQPYKIWPPTFSHINEKTLFPSSLTVFYYTTELHPWAQTGLGALGLVSAGCHSLIKAAWLHDHTAIISVYLCIRGASSVYAWLHECGYSSL